MNEKVNNSPFTAWGIKRKGNGRCIIIDTDDKHVLDDAQGNGFKTYDAAYSYGYNKYHNQGQCNGEPNIDEFNSLI